MESFKRACWGYSYSRILTFEGSTEQKLLITDEPKAMERVSRKL